MSDHTPETRVDQPTDAPEAPAPPFAVGRADFYQSVGYLEGTITKEALSIRQFIGWVLLTLGLVAVLLGWSIMVSKGRK